MWLGHTTHTLTPWDSRACNGEDERASPLVDMDVDMLERAAAVAEKLCSGSKQARKNVDGGRRCQGLKEARFEPPCCWQQLNP